MNNKISKPDRLVNVPGSPELSTRNQATLDRIHKLIQDELSKSDHLVSIEGKSKIEVKQSVAGFIGIIYCADGSYGATPYMETYDAALIEARWRSRAWHDEPKTMENEDEKTGEKRKRQVEREETMQTNYLYPPGSVARGHLELLGEGEYLAVIKLCQPANGDEFTLYGVDPVNARERAELFCQKLGIHLENFTVDKTIMDAWKNIAGYIGPAGQPVKPDYQASIQSARA